MRVGDNIYPQVINVPAKKPFWKCAAAAMACLAVFGAWGLLLAWRG